MLIIRQHHPRSAERLALFRRPGRHSAWPDLAGSDDQSDERARPLPVDVYDTPERYVVTTNLPGADPSQVEVTVEGNQIRIQAHLPERKEGAYLLCERRTGSFARTLDFRNPIQPDGVQATFGNGVVELVVPKSPESLPQQIKIAAA